MIHKDAFLPLNVMLNHTTQKKRSQVFNLGFLIQELLLVASCFLIGRAVLFNEVAPFGISLFAVLLYKRMGGLGAFLAVTAGLLSYKFGSFSSRYIVVMLLFTMLWTFVNSKSLGWTKFRTAAVMSTCLLVVNTVFSFFNGFLAYELILGFFESIVGFIMVYIFSQVADVVKDQKRRRILSSEEIICISIFLSLLIIGFWNIDLFSFSLRNIFSVFLILLFAYIGGAGVGAAIGITVGFMLSLTSSPDPILMGNLAMCGLLAGTFKELGRGGSCMAFLLANTLMTFYINQSTSVILPFGEIAGAILLIMIFPKKGILYLKQFLDYTFVRSKDQQYYVKRMQELTVGRLNEFSQVFHHLSRAFGRISERKSVEGQEELSKLFDLVAEQVCKGCVLYRSCWQRDFYNTYSNMFDLLTVCESKGYIEKEDIPQGLSRRCLNPKGLVEAINNIYTIYRSNLKWQQRIHDCRQLVAEQLDGVSHVVTQLAAELDMDIRFKNDIEDAICIELDRNGIRAKEVLVLEKAGGKIEVSITKLACMGKLECHKQVQNIVSNVVGKAMSSAHKGCTQGGKKDCTLRFVESRQFEIITGVSRTPKHENKTCGDSYSFTSIKDGKYLLALSDGMGSGARAAEESGAVISLMENFLEAGFDQNITIRTINSILMLRSREEIFATADLCILDLVGASSDFIKIGGVPSFIRREDRVEIIKQAALPIGILEDVQMENISTQIWDEDIIVMVTDGILDAFSIMGDGEKSLASFIATLDTTNPQEMADLIMEEAMMHIEGEAKDDMTVMASRVWKPLAS